MDYLQLHREHPPTVGRRSESSVSLNSQIGLWIQPVFVRFLALSSEAVHDFLSFLLALHLDLLVYSYALQQLIASLAQTSSSSVSFCASAAFISSSFFRVNVSTFSEALLLSSEETSPPFSNASRS